MCPLAWPRYTACHSRHIYVSLRLGPFPVCRVFRASPLAACIPFKRKACLQLYETPLTGYRASSLLPVATCRNVCPWCFVKL